MPSSLPEDNPFRAGVLPETQVLLAGQDLLTGLSSRSGLEAHFRLASARARRSGARFAVGLVAVGVDPLQPADEVFGHDLVMVEAARRLRSTLRETDLIARLGETRFAFVSEEVSPEGAEAIAGRIRLALSGRAGDSAVLPPQIGVALWESADQSLALLLRQAEQALTLPASAATAVPTAANAESFGEQAEGDPEPPRSTGQRLARRAIGWLSLATLVMLAVTAVRPEWSAGWLPLGRLADAMSLFDTPPAERAAGAPRGVRP